jgi:hypothetical protein
LVKVPFLGVVFFLSRTGQICCLLLWLILTKFEGCSGNSYQHPRESSTEPESLRAVLLPSFILLRPDIFHTNYLQLSLLEPIHRLMYTQSFVIFKYLIGLND